MQISHFPISDKGTLSNFRMTSALEDFCCLCEQCFGLGGQDLETVTHECTANVNFHQTCIDQLAAAFDRPLWPCCGADMETEESDNGESDDEDMDVDMTGEFGSPTSIMGTPLAPTPSDFRLGLLSPGARLASSAVNINLFNTPGSSQEDPVDLTINTPARLNLGSRTRRQLEREFQGVGVTGSQLVDDVATMLNDVELAQAKI